MKLSLLNLGRGSVVRAQLCPSATLTTTRTVRSRANLWLMRLSLAYSILIASSIQLLASNTHGQTIDKEFVTIELQNDSLVEMVRKIEAQSTLRFIYLPEQLSKYGSVTLSRGKRTIRETLNLALIGTGLAYEESGKYVVLKDTKEVAGVRSVVSQPVLSASLVKGKVTDKDGQGIVGVNIVVKGTTSGTTTDASGEYALVAEMNDVLVFSFIGYKTQEVGVASRTTVDVGLENDVAALKAVTVNAGYYDVDDRQKTGSIATVTAAEIERAPVTNALQAMQGRTPGVTILQNSGVPGSNFQVRVRGTNSLNNGNNPLYVIDGVPFLSESLSDPNTSGSLYGTGTQQSQRGISPLNSINPSDIESIQILKDADATAIYGSRGANGVVLITTKKGKAGATKVDINVKSGVSLVTRRLDLMNTQQYLTMRNEAVANDETSILSDEYDINGTWDQSRYTDWQKVLIGGTAKMTDVNASVSGGNNETQFLFGTGYNTQGTVFPGSNTADRFSTHFSVMHTSPSKKFITRLSTNYSINKNNIVAVDFTSTASMLTPNAPALYNVNGELNWENGTWSNPLGQLKNRFNSNTYNLLTNVELGYEIVKDLRIKANFGLNDIQNEEKRTKSSESKNPASATPAISDLLIGSGSNRSWIIEPQMNWERNIANGKLSVMVGGTYQSRTAESTRTDYYGFSSNALINNPKSATTTQLQFYSHSQYRYIAAYGRVNYSWKEKYFVNITGRRDGSSRFGPDNQFANLGAVGAAWIFSNESFLQNRNHILSFGKVRGSYGITGNDQIGDYQYLDTYSSGNSYNGVTALVPSQLFNPHYGWETNKKMEGAVELGFFGDRILLTMAYYRNRSSNQLIAYKLAATTGNASVLRNFPAMVQNTGIEIDLTTTNVIKGYLKWTSSLNVTLPSNKLISFPNLESSSYANTYVVGKSLTIQKAYHYLGVDPATGVYQFEDMNHDGAITIDDQQSIVQYNQKFYGGLNNGFSYKGLQIDIFFQFIRQTGARYNSSYTVPGDFASGLGNQPVSVLNGRWQEPGDHATRQYFSRSDDLEYTQQVLFSSSDAVAQNIYLIRLKNISISYQLPESVMRGVKSRLYLQGQNLIAITNYSGMDPETGSTILPPLTTFIAGLQLTF